MTTVLPWNSRMYGSASRRVATSRTVSGRVVGIDRHVAVGQIREEHLGLVALPGKAHDVLDLLARDALGERRQVEGTRRAARADRDALDRDVELERRGVGERAARRRAASPRPPPPRGGGGGGGGGRPRRRGRGPPPRGGAPRGGGPPGGGGSPPGRGPPPRGRRRPRRSRQRGRCARSPRHRG